MLKRECRDIGVQSILCGVVLSLLLFPYYQSAVAFLTEQLKDRTHLNTDAMIFSILSTFTHTSCYVVFNGMFAYFDAYGVY
jgi:hypothetical protein